LINNNNNKNPGSVSLLDSATTGTTTTVNPPADLVPCSSSVADSASVVDSGTAAIGTTTTVNPPADGPSAGVMSDNDQNVTFASLMPIPHRERPQSKSTRKRPPSYNLASDEHWEFVNRKMSTEKKTKPKDKAAKHTNRSSHTGSSGLSGHTRRPKQKLPAKSVSSKGKAKANKFGSSDTTPSSKEKAKANKFGSSDTTPSSKGKAKAKKFGSSDTTQCGSCGTRFCDDVCGEKWIQYQLCCRWYHNACQGIDNEQDTFICISCDDSDSD